MDEQESLKELKPTWDTTNSEYEETALNMPILHSMLFQISTKYWFQ